MGKKEQPAQATGGNPAAAKGATVEKCGCQDCKAYAARFGFCNEHFDHYKFGLINKKGEKVLDYERKFEHFTAFKAKQKTARAA